MISRMIDWHTHFVARDLEPGPSARGAWPGISRDRDGLQLTLGGAPYRRIDARSFDGDARVAEFGDLGVETQVLSPPPFVLAFDGPQIERVSLARQQNAAMLDAAHRHPGRFSVLAILPVGADPRALDDVLGQIDQLDAEPAVVGVCLLAGRHDFTLADTDGGWRELWSALEARAWLAFVHPDASTVAEPDRGIGTPFGFGLPAATGRFGARFVGSSWSADLRRMRLLLAHAGGTLTSVLDRLHKAWSMAGEHGESPRSVAQRLLFLDSVAYGRAPCVAALEALGPGRLVFGSDYPFAAGVDLADLAELGGDLVDAVAEGSAVLAGALARAVT
jgi:aminocarboxymuconate-semialdehyde decarboxylase